MQYTISTHDLVQSHLRELRSEACLERLARLASKTDHREPAKGWLARTSARLFHRVAS